MKKLNFNLTYFGLILLFILIGFWSLIGASVLLILLVIALIIQARTENIVVYLTTIDGIVLLILASEFFSYYYSIYRPTSGYALGKSIITTSFYFILRILFTNKFPKALFLNMISIYGGLLSIITLLFFLMFSFNVSYSGLSSLTDFRNLYLPFGIVSNIWVTVLLCLMPFMYISFFRYNSTKSSLRHLMLFLIFLLVLALLVSFSRGAYFALATFVVVLIVSNLIWKQITMRQSIKSFLPIGAALLFVSLVYTQPFLNTIQLFKTESQRRSFVGRTAIIEPVLEIVKSRPVFGIGVNNFPLVSSRSKTNLDDSTFKLVRLPSLPMQTILERGVVGLLLLTALVIGLIFRIISQIKTETGEGYIHIFLLAGIVSIVIRELSFSSVFENDGLRILITTIIICIATNDVQEIKSVTYEKKEI